ncbi:helix-turn-helix domain-containing protein [Limnothrix sp. PR1529]|uniref:helix-turn-helix domain-containing protein n=1 Tax=Limnothrix sp. PR1529 TaxID=1704291 RepID=UPI000A75D336
MPKISFLPYAPLQPELIDGAWEKYDYDIYRISFFNRIGGMGRAGKALKSVLDQHNISQNRLAVLLQVDRSVVFKWFHEQRDPTAETVVEIVTALKGLNPEAARDFVQCYLGELLE